MSTPKGMLAARTFAILVIVGVGAAAFRLSFTTLRDLAKLANIPASDAWLFPVIVDGTIGLATLGMLVLAKSPERRFFVRVLIAGAAVSIVGNSVHAAMDGSKLPWWAAALVAAVAPVSLLVDTHGLAILLRAGMTTVSAADAVAEPVGGPVEDVAAEPVSVSDPAPVSAPAPAAAAPAVASVSAIRSQRPVAPEQQLLPIAVPVGGS